MGKITPTHKTHIYKKPIKITLNWLIAVLILIFSTGLLIIFSTLNSSTAFANYSPSAKIHHLPSSLLNWQDSSNSGDYFNQITPVKVGYLIWSKFPITIAVEVPKIDSNQGKIWTQAVLEAVGEWNNYLPLKVVESKELADIRIIRKSPPLQGNPPRARSAQTTYNLYNQNHYLYHKSTILISPSQTGKYLIAAARHELGHALGIWGHSPVESDSLYFSQVSNPPLISVRDVNTLKRVYQQPTKLGYPL
ncbi:peptidase [Calothrix sp. PCC 6303]|uniref:peptidase n=1 Tax=Calothrix sp. PCC 6303 TaxID=1170562 RepID=UPI0002A043C5|nr:peptidase [Calothrix sp. PCC 6303]AFZ03625.1 peptidase metallopeptidase [Calothrix sp. PCC 6303]